MFNNSTSPLTLEWSQKRNPNNYVTGGSGQKSSGVPTDQNSQTYDSKDLIPTETLVDPAQQAAYAAAAKASQLRGEVTALANSIKDIFNSRYGSVDAAAQEQSNKLGQRYADESSDINSQVEQENQKLGAAHAAAGTYDSSYRGNNVDTVTRGGQSQIRDLGSELQDNLGKVGNWAAGEKASYDANKLGIDQILARLSQADASDLSQVQSTLESRLADLRSGSADNNTTAQNISALESIAPSKGRAQTLKTTLSAIVAGTADRATKNAIGQKLIENAQLSPEDEQQLRYAFSTDLAKNDENQA